MYESFYGLSSKPFQLNPDPLFYFGSTQHQRAKAYLEYGLHQNEGFIVITGEIGAGKTTILRGLLDNLDATKVVAANLVSTQLGPDDVLRMVCASFGADNKETSKSGLLLSLEATLREHRRAGQRCLLIIDEAQHLSYEALEELRMLSNFQLGTNALLQSFLVGQPEFRNIMYSPRMQQLRQRVIASCHIGPMDAAETRGYIEHRLKCAGASDKPILRDEVFEAVFKASGGVPRRINLVCDRLLLSGFLADRFDFTAEHVSEVVNEIAIETSAPSSSHRSHGYNAETHGPDSSAHIQEFARPQIAPTSNATVESDQAAGAKLSKKLDQLDVLAQRVERIEAAQEQILELLNESSAGKRKFASKIKGGL